MSVLGGLDKSIAKLMSSTGTENEGDEAVEMGVDPIHSSMEFLPDPFSITHRLSVEIGHHESNLFVYIVAAMSAGATSTTITNPLWVIKTRFMVRRGQTLNLFGCYDPLNSELINSLRSFYQSRPRMNIPRIGTTIRCTLSRRFTKWKEFEDFTKDLDHH